MTKKRTLIIVVCAIAAVALVSAAYFGVNANLNNPQKLLSLGERYLLEMDYEQAVVYFERVIKIEPKNVRAYIGAAEAYIALDAIEKAKDVLRRGLAQTGDPTIADSLARLENDNDSNANTFDNAANESPNEPGDYHDLPTPTERVQEDARQQGMALTAEQLTALEPLEKALVDYDMDSAFPLMMSSEIQEVFHGLPDSIDEVYRRSNNEEWGIAYFVTAEGKEVYGIYRVIDFPNGQDFHLNTVFSNGTLEQCYMFTRDYSNGVGGVPYNEIIVR